ncbi:MAG TPA: ribosomal protein S18-alanine N-acetyltransferase [Rhodocyclaceae bacterium]|nr:ribosomal protein S18-alanine N-acetyltransferase [Rhodocyclaceae bacterium]
MIAFVPMTADSVHEVQAIEAVAHESPWTAGNFTDSLTAGHVATLMLTGNSLLGYAVVMHLPDEAELLNITIAPPYQRQGLGEQLLSQVCTAAHAQGALRMFLEVRASNLAAHTLYSHNGFIEVGRRRGYYAAANGQREDAILMAKDL